MCLTVIKHATARSSLPPLSVAERRTLHAICDTLTSAPVTEARDGAKLLTLSPDGLKVAGQMERSFATLDRGQQQQLRYLLWLLERPFFSALLIRKLSCFSALAYDDRKRVLQRLAVSRSQKLRMGFQALRRLALFIFYSTTETRAA